MRDADHLGNDPTLLADQVGRLVRADVGHASLQYRLLETTRAYALEKLAESGELETTSPRGRRLSAGAKRIRTIGSTCDGHCFETRVISGATFSSEGTLFFNVNK